MSFAERLLGLALRSLLEPGQPGPGSAGGERLVGGHQPRVFISYRRADADGVRVLRPVLIREFGAENVLVDDGFLFAGDDLRRSITDVVRGCDVVLPVIGHHWLDTVDGSPGSRLTDVDDYVRLELAEAFEQGVPVLPVLVDGAAMPVAGDLPLEVGRVARLLALSFDSGDGDAGAVRVAEVARKLAIRPRRSLVIPDELCGTWVHFGGSASIRQFDFYRNCTYEHVAILIDDRPEGRFRFDFTHQGGATFNAGVLLLEPFVFGSSRSDVATPADDYEGRRDRPKTIRYHYELRPGSRGQVLVLASPDETLTYSHPY